MKAIYFLALLALLLAVSIQSAPVELSFVQPAEGENQLAATKPEVQSAITENEDETGVMRYKRHLNDIQERSKRSKMSKKLFKSFKKGIKKMIKKKMHEQNSHNNYGNDYY